MEGRCDIRVYLGGCRVAVGVGCQPGVLCLPVFLRIYSDVKRFLFGNLPRDLVALGLDG